MSIARIETEDRGLKRSRTGVLGHVAFWTAAMLIVVMGWTLYQATERARRDGLEVHGALEALQHIGAVNESLSRAEAAQRGFFLVADERYIAERDQAFEALASAIASLKRVAHSPAIQQRIAPLESLVADRREIMRGNEAVRRTQGLDAVLPRVASGVGQQSSAKIYDLTAQMRIAKQQQLDARRQAELNDYEHVIRVLIIGVVVLLLVVLPAYAAFVREANARRRAEWRMSELAEALPGSVFQYRSYPDGRRRFEFISRSAERVRGIDPERALADPAVVTDTIVESDRARIFSTMAEAEKTLSPVEIDYHVLAPGGAVRWFRTTASPSRASDGSVLWSGQWADVTEKKNMERALVEAKEAADAASRAKSTFLATMSHEIRTPMNGVLGMLELLSLTRLDGEQRTTLQVVRESGKSLLRIIDDILDFSKIEAGKLELKPEPSSVANVVERVWNIYSGNASSKGLVLTRYTDARISPAVMVDPVRLQQILNNFVSNAIKFTARGEVAIRAELAERRDAEDWVRFTVEDSGIGISREEKERLFQPFTQARDAFTPHPGGTGLGLSICQRLAVLMGGSIQMESEVGVGTRLSLLLPLPIAEAEAVVPAPGAPVAADRTAAFAGRRAAPDLEEAKREGTLVLLVDDHPINRMVLLKQVNALGYAAEVAENGLDALDRWSCGGYGAVITDCNMPEMNGYELARHIRACEARAKHARTPIIACTANALGGEAENCLAAGMDDYLAKPVDLTLLARKLEQWLPLPGAAGTSAPAPLAAVVRLPVAAVSPIDAATLAEISGGEPDFEREILARFRQHNAEDANLLMNAVEKGDLEEVTTAAHRIKGASKTIGALGLAAVADRIERAGRDNDWTAIKWTMEPLRSELERLEAHIETLAPRQPMAMAAKASGESQ